MKDITALPKDLLKLVEQHLVLIEPLNEKHSRFKLEIWTGGYQDMMYTIADLTKVCMLALETADSGNFAEIRDPNSNIAGVLGLILNMIPYEEAELLDKLNLQRLNNRGSEAANPD